MVQKNVALSVLPISSLTCIDKQFLTILKETVHSTNALKLMKRLI